MSSGRGQRRVSSRSREPGRVENTAFRKIAQNTGANARSPKIASSEECVRPLSFELNQPKITKDL